MTYLTDEQRRDATQMRDFTTGVNPFGALGAVRFEDVKIASMGTGFVLRARKAAAAGRGFDNVVLSRVSDLAGLKSGIVGTEDEANHEPWRIRPILAWSDR